MFLASVLRHHRQRPVAQIATAPFKLGNIEDHLSRLNTCTTTLSLYIKACETEYSHRSFDGLEASLRDATKSLEHMAEDLGKIPNILAEVKEMGNRQL